MIKTSGLFLIGLTVLLLFWQPATNINAQNAISEDLSKDSMSFLRRSCFDCHNDIPYNDNVPRALQDDVNDGLDELNFSDWSSFSKRKKVRVLKGSIRQISRSDMPTADYLDHYPEAAVSDSELAGLEDDYDYIRGRSSKRKASAQVKKNQKNSAGNPSKKRQRGDDDDYDDDDHDDDYDDDDYDDDHDDDR